MGYKNKTNKEYQHEYYSKNKVKRNQYNKDYYMANYDYIRVYQYLYLLVSNCHSIFIFHSVINYFNRL